MKRFIAALLVTVSMVSHAATLNIEHWKTQQGTKVLFVATHTNPIVDLRVIFTAGSAYDGKQYGLAQLANNLLSEGTATQTADQIADGFDSVGADFSTNVNADMAVVSLRTLTKPDYYKKAVANFIDVLAHPSFTETSLNRVKKQTLAAIKVGYQTPDYLAEKTFFGLLYGDQPYGHGADGTLQSVPSITQKAVKDFYQQYYVARNAAIVIVGDLTRSNAERLAKAVSSALQEGKAAKVLSMSTMDHPGVVKHIEFPSQQTTIVLGQLGITRNNPQYFPLIVGNTILGGLPLSSLLFEAVRESKGLAYYAVSQFQPLRYKGPFTVQLKTRVNKTDEAVTTVKHTLDEFISQGPSAQQLTTAKQFISGSFPLSIATNKAIAGVLVYMAFYNRPLDYLDTYLAKINAVTTTEVKRAFEKTLQPNKMILVTVGPKTGK